MVSPNSDLRQANEDVFSHGELEPDRVRAVLMLNRWGGRMAATAGALLPAALLLVYRYAEAITGNGKFHIASPVGVVLTMAYFAVLQYMLFVVGGTLVKTRYELNRRLDDIERGLLRRAPASGPDGPRGVQPGASPSTLGDLENDPAASDAPWRFGATHHAAKPISSRREKLGTSVPPVKGRGAGAR